MSKASKEAFKELFPMLNQIEEVKKEADTLMMNKMIKHQEEVNLAYSAGLFDGEGCIMKSITMKYNPVMKKRYPCNTIRVEVCNTDFGLIEYLHGFFNLGAIVKIPPRKTATGKLRKPQLRWNLTHRQAYQFLKRVLKYLKATDKIKKAHAVIEHYESR